MAWFEDVSDALGILLMVLFGLLVAAAIIRSVIKASKGENISVHPVGVMNDLPSSVTGINKHNDMADRVKERADRKTE